MQKWCVVVKVSDLSSAFEEDKVFQSFQLAATNNHLKHDDYDQIGYFVQRNGERKGIFSRIDSRP